MKNLPAARLIIHPTAPGKWNMAVDEALLQTAAQRSSITLRIYRWEEPTVSLGYFQTHAQRQAHPASRDCPLVRRATGGGAIIHDAEVTYSLTAPVTDRLNLRILRWYDLVHQAWATTLGCQGAAVALCPATDTARETEFLCFRRRSAGDLLLDGWKIGGSAQRRRKSAALQHGSLLLKQSTAAPELPGFEELTGCDLARTTWLEDWISRLGEQFGVRWHRGELDEAERSLASHLQDHRFGSSNWTLRR